MRRNPLRSITVRGTRGNRSVRLTRHITGELGVIVTNEIVSYEPGSIKAVAWVNKSGARRLRNALSAWLDRQ